MKVAILGASGMLGSMVLDVFSKTTDFNIIATCRDAKHFKTLRNTKWTTLDARTSAIEDLTSIFSGVDYVINCIGIIKTEINETNSDDIQKAIEVNALFPHKLDLAAKKTNPKVIQIATDCVYDGAKGSYLETDAHNPLDVYGKTKSLGEVNSEKLINLRCSIIGPEIKTKSSLLEWFLNQPSNTEVMGFENHFWNGVTTYHFAKICIGIIKNELNFNKSQHIIPNGIVSKARMLSVFAEIFNRNDLKIIKTQTDISIDRTLSTVNEEFNTQIWKNAGYEKPPTFQEMVSELNSYITNNNFCEFMAE